MGLGKKFLEVFWDSFRSLFHGRVPLAALLVGTPLMFTVLFGVIYDADVVNDITLTVYDEDQTSLSRTVVQAYADADRFRVVSYVASEEEMKAEIHRFGRLEVHALQELLPDGNGERARNFLRGRME